MRHEKAGQLLKLALALASSAEGMTLEEIARDLGVVRRTAERLRDALWDLFPGMEEVPDPPYKRYRIPGGLHHFMQIPTTDELVELSKAAESLRQNGATPRADALVSLEKKIRSSMKTTVLRRVAPDADALVRAEMIAVQAGPKPHEDQQLIGRIRQAVMAMKLVRFCYRGGARPGEKRDVVPYGIMFGRTNYLVGAEAGFPDPRNYRLDRIEDLELLDLAGACPEDFSLHDYAARSFGVYQGDTAHIVLRVLPDSADEALGWRFHPTQTVEAQKDGSVLVSFTASGLRELSWHLFTWRDQVEIIEPAALRHAMIAELELALARHRWPAE